MGFINESFKKEMSKKIEEGIAFKQILPDEQLKEIMPEVIKFYESNEKGFFNDGLRDFVVIKTPVEGMKPKKVQSRLGGEIYNWFCNLSGGGFISIFATKEQCKKMGWSSVVCVTGRVKTQYQYIGKKGYFKKIEDMAKKFDLEKDEITESDYREVYSLNVVQVIT